MDDMGTAMLGRGIAAVGVVLAFIALWVDSVSFSGQAQRYWDDGTFSGLVIILAVLAALALVGAVSTGERDYDLAYGVVGGIAWGMYLFFPAVLAFDQLDLLDTGGWLGFCSLLVVIGSIIATTGPAPRASRPAPLGTLLAVAGIVLVFVGIWPDFIDGGGSYWNVAFFGHTFGILLILLCVLGALGVLLAQTTQAGTDTTLWVAAVTMGATWAIPVGNAFNELGHLGTGAWLAGIGGIVFMLGAAAMQWMAAGAPAVQAPPATPPPPTAG